MFFGSDHGSRIAAILTRFTTTCKQLDMDPWVYLRGIFSSISAYEHSRIKELLSDNWRAGRKPPETHR